MGLGFLSNNFTAIIAVLLVFLVYYITWNNRRIYDDILTGFWRCPADFLAEADLSSFLLYLAPPDWKGVRACYVLAERGADLVINEPASITLTQDWSISNWALGLSSKTYTADFFDLETDDFPSSQKLVLHPKTGKIIMSKDDTVYAILYKDSISTETLYAIPETQ